MTGHSDAYKAFYVKRLCAEKEERLQRIERVLVWMLGVASWIGAIALVIAYIKYVP